MWETISVKAHRPVGSTNAEDKPTGWAISIHPPLLRMSWRRNTIGSLDGAGFIDDYRWLTVPLLHLNTTVSYLGNVICWSSHLLFGFARDGAVWSRITQCVWFTDWNRNVTEAQCLTAAPRNEYNTRRTHCSCLVPEHTARTRAHYPTRAARARLLLQQRVIRYLDVTTKT